MAPGGVPDGRPVPSDFAQREVVLPALGPDGCAIQVAMTDEGERLLRAGLSAHIPQLDTDVVQRLTATQRRQLQNLLGRIDPGERTR